MFWSIGAKAHIRTSVSYTHLRAHETVLDLVCRLLLEKKVIYEPVKLTQEFRNFDSESPWEGMENKLFGDEKSNGEN